jgi:hypothetical protein
MDACKQRCGAGSERSSSIETVCSRSRPSLVRAPRWRDPVVLVPNRQQRPYRYLRSDKRDFFAVYHAGRWWRERPISLSGISPGRRSESADLLAMGQPGAALDELMPVVSNLGGVEQGDQLTHHGPLRGYRLQDAPAVDPGAGIFDPAWLPSEGLDEVGSVSGADR